MQEMPYFLGCPLWSNKAWVGELFSNDAKPADFLKQYAQAISHSLRLKNAGAETKAFLERLAALESRLGPFFLQLPPAFCGNEFFALVAFLNGLPKLFKYAVEVRHNDLSGIRSSRKTSRL
jgi:uncharacterized protein YecE (DUF72 family)